ncbi:MAG: peptidase-C39 like family protein [Desulfobulbaceae bacterium]|nr:MAG: peptidase-C39 like family protein [Desulfobulbaceae bacterium]
MVTKLHLDISMQPDDITCGPACLHSVYEYYGDSISLQQVITEVKSLKGGGTLAVLLANHALKRGYRATIYTYNLHVFDPTWFTEKESVAEKLKQQEAIKNDEKLTFATHGYLEFLERGGSLLFEDLTIGLIRKFLKKSIPILTGLSSTYLYRAVRENPENDKGDNIAGIPTGHFVVLCGYDKSQREVLVADPYKMNPVSNDHYYMVSIARLLGAVLLGILTHDANLLIIEPTN